MSIPSWPATLPQNILAQGYKGGLPNNLLRQPTDIGPAKVRRRGTVAAVPVTGNILVTPTELAALITFYETTLLNGSLRFRWKDPLVVDDITTTLIASLSGVTMNLSFVDALAFISNPSTDLSDYEYTKIIVTDSSGKKAIGYIKSAGSGETYSNELVTNGDMSEATGWTGTGWEIGSGIATATATSNFLYRTLSNTPGQLLKWSFNLLSRTAGSTGFRRHNVGTVALQTVPAIYTGYKVDTSAGVSVGVDALAFSGTVDDISCKAVTSPSATGATITSTPGGSTYNWASIEAGFNYNGTSYSVDLYATEMRFVEPPTWNWVDGYFEVVLPLEILK